jgi:UDP-N-acetylmuramoyl-L-alanyl-D-glutamate--2,6-diaminopimelate ligase
MGAAAAGADRVIVTDDNPRSEDPAAIRAAVLAGADAGPASVVEVPEREPAVRRAVLDAEPGDVVLVLGRGHETLQELAQRSVPLDDRDLVRRALGARTGDRHGARDVPPATVLR